jgi:hypothetical protein
MTDPLALREHLFLTGLAVVVGAGTVMLFGTWVVHVVHDAVEDYFAERRGEFETEERAPAFAEVDCEPRVPEERHVDL